MSKNTNFMISLPVRKKQLGEIDKATNALGRAISDEIRTVIREELRLVVPQIIREINDHTDAVHTQLRADLRDQGLAISPVARTKG